MRWVCLVVEGGLLGVRGRGRRIGVFDRGRGDGLFDCLDFLVEFGVDHGPELRPDYEEIK